MCKNIENAWQHFGILSGSSKRGDWVYPLEGRVTTICVGNILERWRLPQATFLHPCRLWKCLLGDLRFVMYNSPRFPRDVYFPDSALTSEMHILTKRSVIAPPPLVNSRAECWTLIPRDTCVRVPLSQRSDCFFSHMGCCQKVWVLALQN